MQQSNTQGSSSTLKPKSKVLLPMALVLTILSFGSLAFAWYKTYYALPEVPPEAQIINNIDDEYIQDSSILNISDSAINLPKDIEIYDGSFIKEKLRGVNGDGKLTDIFKFQVQGNHQNVLAVTDYYKSQFKDNGWVSISENGKVCVQEGSTCQTWQMLIYEKDSTIIKLVCDSPVTYEIIVSQNENSELGEAIIANFPKELLNESMNIIESYVGIDSEGNRKLELRFAESVGLQDYLESLISYEQRQDCASGGYSNKESLGASGGCGLSDGVQFQYTYFEKTVYPTQVTAVLTHNL